MIRRMASSVPDIARQLRGVLDRIAAAAQKRPQHLQSRDPRLVAVSKTKPASMIIEAYAAGQRHFGENYVQELVEKANDPEILTKCVDVKWHFIGNLQRNKVNKVTSIPGLYMVETVDSEKLAIAINNSWGKLSPSQPLAIFLQVNTSGEESKNGADPLEAPKIALFLRDKCPNLRFAGLMTIGALESSISEDENPDFNCLVACRKAIADSLGIPEMDLELSMGMSQDFEKAIEAGSTNVRVGSTIFGARPIPPIQEGNTASSSTTSSAPHHGDLPASTTKCVGQDASGEMADKLSELNISS